MERRDGHPDARDPEEPCRLRGQRRADERQRGQHGWDAWDGVRRDAAEGALRERPVADARCAGRLAGQERGGQVRDGAALRG